MHCVRANVLWKILILSISLVSFNQLIVSSTTICTACEENCPAAILNSGDCFCEHHSTFHKEKQWNSSIGPYGKMVIQQVLTYASAECFELKKFDENNFLNPSICPEESCRALSFSRSKISTVPTNFFTNFSNLEELHLINSGIQTLQVGAFNDLPKLRFLQLENNELKKISNGTFNVLSSLVALHLQNNQINIIENMSFVGLESLMLLDLSNNRLSAISYDLFEPLGFLKRLNLSYNFLSVVHFHTAKLKFLEILYLNNNNIERVEGCFEGTFISSLFLQDNRISFFNGSCVPDNLLILNLANNNMSFVDSHTLGNLKNLNTLNMSKNAIKTIPVDMFKDSVELLTLDLSQNKITQLKTGVFSNAKKIEELYLRDMNLKKINPYVLVPLTNLQVLDISENDIDHLDSELFDHFSRLRKIMVENNHLSCETAASMFKLAEKKRFSLVFNANYTVENINGLACETAQEPRDTTKNNKMETSTQSRFQDEKNSNEETSTYGAQSSLEDFRNLMKMQHNLLRNMSIEIMNIKNSRLEKEISKKIDINNELLRRLVKNLETN